MNDTDDFLSTLALCWRTLPDDTDPIHYERLNEQESLARQANFGFRTLLECPPASTFDAVLAGWLTAALRMDDEVLRHLNLQLLQAHEQLASEIRRRKAQRGAG